MIGPGVQLGDLQAFVRVHVLHRDGIRGLHVEQLLKIRHEAAGGGFHFERECAIDVELAVVERLRDLDVVGWAYFNLIRGDLDDGLGRLGGDGDGATEIDELQLQLHRRDLVDAGVLRAHMQVGEHGLVPACLRGGARFDVGCGEGDALDVKEGCERFGDVQFEFIARALRSAHLLHECGWLLLLLHESGIGVVREVLAEVRGAAHGLGVDDADDDAEVLIATHGIRSIDASLQPHFAEQFIEIRDLFLCAEREGIVLGDDERAGKVAVFQILVQRVLFISESIIHNLRKHADVRLRCLTGQCDKMLADARQGGAVHGFAEIDLTVRAYAEQAIEPAHVGINVVVAGSELGDLLAICGGSAIEVILGLQVFLLVADHAHLVVGRDEFLEVFEVTPLDKQRPSERKRTRAVAVACKPAVDHLQCRAVAIAHEIERLCFIALRHAGFLHVHLAPALAEVLAHARDDEEEQRLIHLVHRAKDFLDVRGAIRLRIAVSEIEGLDDLAVIRWRDAGLTKQSHHARETLDVLLHHDRGDRNARVIGQVELAAQLLRDLRIVRLRPYAEKVLRQRGSGARAAFADLDDALGSLIKVRTRQDEPRHADIDAVSHACAQSGEPFACRRLRHQILGQDKALRVVRGLLREGVLRFAGPNIGHHLDDLRPWLFTRLHQVAEQVCDIGLHGDVLRARDDFAVAVALHLAFERGEQFHRGRGV